MTIEPNDENLTSITVRKGIYKRLWDLKFELDHRRLDETISHLIDEHEKGGKVK